MTNDLHLYWQYLFHHRHQHLFYDIITHYQEPHRHYHNITHLYECLLWFDDIQDKLHRKDLVLLALFYHDVIYDSKSHHNEKDSADKTSSDLQDILLKADIAIIHRYILAAKDHLNPLTDEQT